MASTSPTQLEFVYPILIDEDVDSTEPTIDSQTTATIITNNMEAVSQPPKNTSLSNVSVTTTKTPHAETNATDVDLSILAPRKGAQNSQNITTLDDKNDKPADIHDGRLLNEISGEFLFCFKIFFLFFFLLFFTTQPCRKAKSKTIRLMS